MANSKYNNIVVAGDISAKVGDFAADMQIPLLNSINIVPYPFVMSSLLVEDPRQVAMLHKVMLGDRQIGIFPEIPSGGVVRTMEIADAELPEADFLDR